MEPFVCSKGKIDAKVKLLEILFARYQKVGEQIWHDYGQKYKGHEFQQMDGYGTVYEPLLYL